MTTATDHLVVVAHTLAQGVAWCESTWGVTPGPGGQHALMGTHNRLLSIGSLAHPNAYLEIIAIDPQAPPPTRARWFGMDDPALQAAVCESPRFVHVVARTRNAEMLRWGLIDLGLDPGVPVAAQRDTPQGQSGAPALDSLAAPQGDGSRPGAAAQRRLAWRILLRDDGQIDRGFALPTLIEWQGRHPTEDMPASPVQLKSVQAGGMPARVATLLQWRGLVRADAAEPRWQVTLQAPVGDVTLTSWTGR